MPELTLKDRIKELEDELYDFDLWVTVKTSPEKMLMNLSYLVIEIAKKMDDEYVPSH